MTLSGYTNVKDFGAVGDGVNDDTNSIRAAITDCGVGGIIFLPPGSYRITTELVINSNVSIIGAGSESTNTDTTPPGTQAVTRLLYDPTSPGGAVIKQLGVTTQRIQDLSIDGNGKADVGIGFDRFRFGIVEHVRIMRVQAYGILAVPKASYAHDNFMGNMFTNIQIASNATCIRLDGITESEKVHGNCCHNSFHGLFLDHCNWAIELGDCDNNAFYMTYIFRRKAFGQNTDVVFDIGARSNRFYHLQGEVYAKGRPNEPNGIWGYDTENGQAHPYVEPGSKLYWSEWPCKLSHFS
ncbi:MAG: glycosyl hydrolase family 28-related protein [Sedimentisphaerales bacterium]|jgi:hypothetical protein